MKHTVTFQTDKFQFPNSGGSFWQRRHLDLAAAAWKLNLHLMFVFLTLFNLHLRASVNEYVKYNFVH